eukprot:9289796-Alexandrium_andersonii.AAC.1
MGACSHAAFCNARLALICTAGLPVVAQSALGGGRRVEARAVGAGSTLGLVAAHLVLAGLATQATTP